MKNNTSVLADRKVSFASGTVFTSNAAGMKGKGIICKTPSEKSQAKQGLRKDKNAPMRSSDSSASPLRGAGI